MITKAQADFLIKLKKKKYREMHQKFLVENPKVIWEEYSNPLLDSVYVTDPFYEENEDRMVFKNTFRVSVKSFKSISSQVNSQGMMALFNIPRAKNFKFQSKNILLLDNIQDPGNLGTIIRTADWFGFKYVFLGKNCVEAYNPKVVAASMGSIFAVNIYSDVNLIDLIKDLKEEKYNIMVTDLNGRELAVDKQAKTALVIGNEAKGVDKKIKAMADQSFKIMKSGKAESLNAAVATGIIMNKIKF